jgi:hypothetical protein
MVQQSSASCGSTSVSPFRADPAGRNVQGGFLSLSFWAFWPRQSVEGLGRESVGTRRATARHTVGSNGAHQGTAGPRRGWDGRACLWPLPAGLQPTSTSTYSCSFIISNVGN